MYPYFVHTKFEVNWCKGYRVIGVGRIAGPHGQLGHFTQSQFSGDLVTATFTKIDDILERVFTLHNRVNTPSRESPIFVKV